MGWRFNWVSSYGSDFNPDYHVSFTPDELAEGTSTTTTPGARSRSRRRPAPASSTGRGRRDLPHLFRPTLAASTSWSAPTISSTSCPRAATRIGSTSPWSGSATTTATTTPPLRSPPADRLAAAALAPARSGYRDRFVETGQPRTTFCHVGLAGTTERRRATTNREELDANSRQLPLRQDRLHPRCGAD